ncbi:MAG: class I SAM-dependent methyltransferase [Actinomycetota bacterium]|nr:class I SAM-dependent methyltransferase [Acidimicrobiia bacterium]MDQ3294094.1 class I SAM-dependent methyltransferase [Actinomycetota bacterium]
MTDTSADLDVGKAAVFAGHVAGILNGGMLALMLTIGHRTGLFRTMSGRAPSTSAEVAEAAGLDERYVREWLAAMVTGRVVEHDAAARTYRLPPEHAMWLVPGGGAQNLAVVAGAVPMLSGVLDDVVTCFREGGGVPYSRFPRFQAHMAEQSAQIFDASLVGVVLPVVPGMVGRLEAGIDVADVGCGKGHAVNVMAAAFPNSRFTGLDISDEGIAAGRAEAATLGLANASFEVHDVASLAGPARFDFVTAFDAVHDQADPTAVLAGIAAVLRDDGTFLMVDIRASSELHENLDHPLGPYIYAMSTMHCMTVSLAAGGAGLGTAWGRQVAERMLRDAGFDAVDVHHLDADVANSYYVARRTKEHA